MVQRDHSTVRAARGAAPPRWDVVEGRRTEAWDVGGVLQGCNISELRYDDDVISALLLDGR